MIDHWKRLLRYVNFKFLDGYNFSVFDKRPSYPTKKVKIEQGGRCCFTNKITIAI